MNERALSLGELSDTLGAAAEYVPPPGERGIVMLESLKARLTQLQSERAAVIGQLANLDRARENTAANINAYNGAISEIERLVAQLEKESISTS